MVRQSSDVVLFGLDVLVPLMSEGMMQLPRLCTKYYQLLDCMCEVYLNRVFEASESLLHHIMTSLEMGMDKFGADICRYTLVILRNLASEHHKRVGQPGMSAKFAVGWLENRLDLLTVLIL